MLLRVTVRYVCWSCGWRWTREVKSRVALSLDRCFSALCPGCAEEGTTP